MASNELTARVTLQGEIKARATLGVPVNVYVDREIYDGETVITPTEDDITLETAGKAVLEDILVHGVPTHPTETWAFTLDDDTVIEKVVILDD